ncbi:1934_t:CDS:2 [Entrophospora sp. SA101]|nr:1903_t:CDS:2 [Entrophospora sp. SA101]CAJ0768228.1 1934_t:CDS:2 [Entrophospora sp. SA101]
MEGFLLNEELDTVRIATALYKRVLTNEWTGDRDIEVNNFIVTLNRIITENTIEIERLEKFQSWGDDLELEQKVISAFEDIRTLLKMQSSGEDRTSWVSRAEENVKMVIRNVQSAMKKCSGLQYKMWEKVKNELGKLDLSKLGYDHPVCSGILDCESEPISTLLPELRTVLQKGADDFLIEKKINDLCEKFTLEEEKRILAEETALSPRIVSAGKWLDSSEKLESITTQIFEVLHHLWVSTKYRAFVRHKMPINETSYMCEVLTRLFDTVMNGIPIKCEAWGAWDKRSLVSASRAGDLRCAKKPDYMFTVEISDVEVELLYCETGRPKSSHVKQLEDHRKLAGLSKDSIEKTRSELKASLKKSTLSEHLSIFTVNVASDIIKIYVMRKEHGILVYRLLTTAKIPLGIASPDETAVVFTLHNLLARLDESSGGQSSDETTSTIEKPRRKKRK